LTGGRYIIVTPYYKETDRLLSRCIESVRRQSVRCDHLLVADGFPSAFIDSQGVRHIKLDTGHNDFGNTPRGIGCLIGVSEDYDGIGLLDADNWLQPTHVASCIEAASCFLGGIRECDFVVARRHLRRPDETIMQIAEEPGLIDTSNLFFLPGSYDALSFWATMPKAVSSIGDRVFTQILAKRGYRAAFVKKPTVNYHNLWASAYQALNEPMPDDAKPNVDAKGLAELGARSPREIEIINRLAGFRLVEPDKGRRAETLLAQNYKNPPRNRPCACGSGRKYKKCCGKTAQSSDEIKTVRR
jgi:hypothetical protein